MNRLPSFAFQCLFNHFIYSLDEYELHLLTDVIRDVIQVYLVPLRQYNGFDPCPPCSQHLFLHPADRQYSTAEGYLSQRAGKGEPSSPLHLCCLNKYYISSSLCPCKACRHTDLIGLFCYLYKEFSRSKELFHSLRGHITAHSLPLRHVPSNLTAYRRYLSLYIPQPRLFCILPYYLFNSLRCKFYPFILKAFFLYLLWNKKLEGYLFLLLLRVP